MSVELDFRDHGKHTIPSGQKWLFVANPNFSGSRWQKLSVFPSRGNPGGLDVKVTIMQEDWQSGSDGQLGCWVLLNNPGPDPIEIGITSITAPPA